MEVFMSPATRYLRRPEVEHRTGFKRCQIYAMIKLGNFPAPVKLSVRAVGWRETDIANWLESRGAD